MTIIEILNKHNLNMRELSNRYNIPYRTIQNWKGGVSEAPEYVLELIDKCLTFEEEK